MGKVSLHIVELRCDGVNEGVACKATRRLFVEAGKDPVAPLPWTYGQIGGKTYCGTCSRRWAVRTAPSDTTGHLPECRWSIVVGVTQCECGFLQARAQLERYKR